MKSILKSGLRVHVPAIAAMMAGCTVGPDYHRPALPAAAGYGSEAAPPETAASPAAGGAAQRFVEGQDIPAQWWTLFHSPALNDWVERAIRANPDLQAANAALRAAMENVRAQRGAYFPSISGNGSASRNQNPTQLSPTLSSSVLLFNLYQAQLNATWTLDVLGGNRRTVEALQAQADAQRYQLESVRLALTANIVAAAVQEAALRAQIAAIQDMIKAGADTLDIFHRQLALGQIAGADVAGQEAAQAQLEQSLPPLQKQLAQQRDLLAALAGGFPNETPGQSFELDSLQLPQELPVSLPSKLVEQRPDIRLAEENLHAADAQIGVAISNRVPNITLSAGTGSVATQAGQLFGPGNGFWGLTGGLTQPIFEGGALMHRTRAAQAVYDEALAQYRSTVITAFQNVADTLHALQSDADAFKAALAAEQATAQSLAIARKQYDLGSVPYIALLNSEQAYQQAKISLIQAQAERLADTAALFQALGGGWWNRS